MPTWLAGLVALAAVVTVYFTCLRPMRRGHCALPAGGQDTELQREIAELREELRILRAQDALDTGRVPSSDPPAADV